MPIIPPVPHSLENNSLGPAGGAAIAEALKVNETVVDIKCVPPCREQPPPCRAFVCYRRGNKTHADHSVRAAWGGTSSAPRTARRSPRRSRSTRPSSTSSASIALCARPVVALPSFVSDGVSPFRSFRDTVARLLRSLENNGFGPGDVPGLFPPSLGSAPAPLRARVASLARCDVLIAPALAVDVPRSMDRPPTPCARGDAAGDWSICRHRDAVRSADVRGRKSRGWRRDARGPRPPLLAAVHQGAILSPAFVARLAARRASVPSEAALEYPHSHTQSSRPQGVGAVPPHMPLEMWLMILSMLRTGDMQ
jgi:hypothetical protein